MLLLLFMSNMHVLYLFSVISYRDQHWGVGTGTAWERDPDGRAGRWCGARTWWTGEKAASHGG